MKNELPVTDDEMGLSKIKNWATLQLQNAVSWINSEDGQILGNAIKSLGSFVIGDSTDIVIPYFFDLSVSTLRRRFLPDFTDLTDRLNESKDRINESFLKSNLGQEILKETIKELIHQKDDEKRELHKQFLINAYTKKDVQQERISTFMNILISLEPIQLRIMNVISNPKETVEKIMKQKDASKPEILLELKNDVRRLLAIDDELFERSLTRLESEGLLRLKNQELLWCSGKYDGRQFEGEAVKRMISSLQNILTAFGSDFMTYFENDS